MTWKHGDWLVQEGKEVGNLPDEALRPDMIEILLENSEMVRQANSSYMEQLAEEGGRSMLPSVRSIQNNPQSEIAKAWNESPKGRINEIDRLLSTKCLEIMPIDTLDEKEYLEHRCATIEILALKIHTDGSLKELKDRFCARGDLMKNLSRSDTCSPVVSHTGLCIALCVYMEWLNDDTSDAVILQLDKPQAFGQSPNTKLVYPDPPKDIEFLLRPWVKDMLKQKYNWKPGKGRKLTFKAVGALYGQSNAPLAHFKHVENREKKIGMRQRDIKCTC